MNAKEKEREEARQKLLEMIKPGDTVYTVLRHVSRSGMYRAIDLYIMQDNQPVWISYTAAKLLEGYDQRHEACRASGCGMDMGFHLVHNLGYALFPDGFQCTGDNRDNHYCPSNDHNNTPYPPRDGKMHHTSGGYALRQRWM